MKSILFLLVCVIAGCSDAGASSEPQTSAPMPQVKCQLKLSAPSYFQGESCPMGDWILQGIQGVTVQNQVVRGVRCVKLALVCTP